MMHKYLIPQPAGRDPNVLPDPSLVGYEITGALRQTGGVPDVAIVGIPFDAGSYRAVGARSGPAGIRKALSYFRAYSCELQIDIGGHLSIADVGDIDVDPHRYETTHARIGEVLRDLLGQGCSCAALGGDHSIAYPTVRSVAAAAGGRIGLVWVDAHFDMTPAYRGDEWFCGSPLLRLLEREPQLSPRNVVHIGARGFANRAIVWENVRKYGFRYFTVADVMEHGMQAVVEEALRIAQDGTTHFCATLDIDAVEGALVPGTQTPTPGGLLPHQFLEAARAIANAGARYAEIVEVAPPLDVAEITAKLAAATLMELLAGWAARLKGLRGEGSPNV